MPLIEYPAGLPGPSASSFTPRDRLARSTLPGDALAGARERDFLGSEELGFVFSADDAAAFDNWWRDTLYSGGLRFAAAWPLPPEFDGSRVRKFARSPAWSHISNGNWRMSVTTEVYGRMAAPELSVLPVLLMRWDGDFVDETGITEFTPTGSYDFDDADSPAFDQVVVGISNGRAFGTSSRDLSIGTQMFTVEGRAKFTGAENGGIVLAKNYWASQPAEGVFKNDYAFFVRPDSLRMQWTGEAETSEIGFTEILDEEFTWSISDDGTLMHFHVNGFHVGSQPSVAVADVPPPVTLGSSISVLNALQGFSGSAPNWSADFYVGRADELRMFIGTALYGAENYTPSTTPFSYP